MSVWAVPRVETNKGQWTNEKDISWFQHKKMTSFVLGLRSKAEREKGNLHYKRK